MPNRVERVEDHLALDGVRSYLLGVTGSGGAALKGGRRVSDEREVCRIRTNLLIQRLSSALLATVLASMAVIGIGANPAAACADWLATDRFQAGFLEPDRYLRTLAVTSNDAVVIANADARAYSTNGSVMADFDDHGDFVEQMVALPGGDVMVRRSRAVVRHRGDGSTAPGYPLAIEAVAMGVDPSGVFALLANDGPPHSTNLGTVHRRLPDGSPDTGFGGDGLVPLVLSQGDLSPNFSPFLWAIGPNDEGGVDALVVWLQTGTGSVLQFVQINPDESVDVIGQLTEPIIRMFEASTPVARDGNWEILVADTDLLQPDIAAARLLHVDRTSGAITTLRSLAPFPANLRRGAHLARAPDGTTLASVGGAYTIIGPGGDDPALSVGTGGTWIALDDPNNRGSNGIAAVDVLSTGEFVFAAHETVFIDRGVYLLRGTTPPERYIAGGLGDQVIRLYRAVLGRDPDAEGATYWSRRRARKADLRALVEEMMDSTEYRTRYGDLSTDDFVEHVYLNILARSPDSSGRIYWTGLLARGEIDRAGMLAYFADSSEHLDTTDTRAPDPLEAELYRLYRAVFLRPPDADGHCYWSTQQDRGLSLGVIAEYFVESSEFENRYGALDDAAFVDLLYRNVLGRPAEPEGLAYWVGQLGAGATRGQVVLGFSESPEFLMVTGTVPP